MDQYFLDYNFKIANILKQLECCRFCSSHKENYYYRFETDDAVYVTFRSSEYIEDYLTDLNCLPDYSILVKNGYTYKGFTQRANEVKNIEEIYNDAVRKGKLLIIGGHSLGGAAATICTFNLLKNHLNSDNIYCITFGSPFAFSEEILNYAKDKLMYKHFIHFIDDYDIVPYLPYLVVPSVVGTYLPLGVYYFIRHEDNYLSLERQKSEERIIYRCDIKIQYWKNHFFRYYDKFIQQYFDCKSSPDMDLYTRLKLPIYTPYETIYYCCARMTYNRLESYKVEAFDTLTDEEKLKSYNRSMIELKNDNKEPSNNIINLITNSRVPRYCLIDNGYKVMPRGMYDYLFMNYNKEMKEGNIPTLSYEEMMNDNRIDYKGLDKLTAKQKDIFTNNCRSQLLRSKPLDITKIVYDIIKMGIDLSVLKNIKSYIKVSASMSLINYVFSIGRDYVKSKSGKRFRSKSEEKLYRKEFWSNIKHNSITVVNAGISGYCGYLVGSLLAGLASAVGCACGGVLVGLGAFFMLNKITDYLEGDDRKIIEEDIKKLETIKEAARMIFDNYDSDDDDKINKEICKILISDIYRLSKLECPNNLDYIVDIISSKDGNVSWNDFWGWLSYRLFDPDNKSRECENIKINDKDVNLLKNIERWSDLELWLYSFSNDACNYSIWRYLSDWKLEYPLVKSRKEIICYCIKTIPNHFKKILRDDYFYDDIPLCQLRRMLASVGGSYKKSDNKMDLIDKINNNLERITSN